MKKLFMKIFKFRLCLFKLPAIPRDKYSPQLVSVMERMMCGDTDTRPSATELLEDDVFRTNVVPQVYYSLFFRAGEINRKKGLFVEGFLNNIFGMLSVKIAESDSIRKKFDFLIFQITNIL